MNSFVKKNGVLVGVLALSGIAALTLLIFIFINLFGLFDKIDETRQASDRVRSLNKSRPAPCEENEKLIKSDIAVLDNAIKGLRGGFDFPLQVAVDEFIKVLEPFCLTDPCHIAELIFDQHQFFALVCFINQFLY